MIKKIIAKITNEEDKISLKEILNARDYMRSMSYHFFDYDKPMSAKMDLAPISSNENDKIILERLKKYYATNKNKFSPSETIDMWQDSYVPMYQSLFEYLEKNEDEKALVFLNNMCKNEATSGYFSGYVRENKDVKPNKYANMLIGVSSLYHMDALVGFAEWLGVIHAESFDHNSREHYVYSEPDEIINLIEQNSDIKIKFPSFQDGYHGIVSSKGIFSNRHFIYMYIALRIKELCKDIPNPRICEIGGGVGLLAYYCNLFGLKDITMVDIPSVSFISSYFMMKNMPERKFLLGDDKGIYDTPDAIKIIFPEHFNNAPDNQFDIVVNCDSFPEINEVVTAEYVENIKRTSKLFYSINHEWYEEVLQNRNVPVIVKNNGGFDRLLRNLFWLRRGYVEELYNVKK